MTLSPDRIPWPDILIVHFCLITYLAGHKEVEKVLSWEKKQLVPQLGIEPPCESALTTKPRAPSGSRSD